MAYLALNYDQPLNAAAAVQNKSAHWRFLSLSFALSLSFKGTVIIFRCSLHSG